MVLRPRYTLEFEARDLSGISDFQYKLHVFPSSRAPFKIYRGFQFRGKNEKLRGGLFEYLNGGRGQTSISPHTCACLTETNESGQKLMKFNVLPIICSHEMSEAKNTKWSPTQSNPQLMVLLSSGRGFISCEPNV